MSSISASTTARRVLQLRDGRQLSYRLAGQYSMQLTDQAAAQQHGVPAALNSSQSTASPPAATVLYHHGWPSSSAEVGVWHAAASQLGLRMVAVDRPGIGASTFSPTGSFASYADDVTELIQHLNLPSVIHVGTSGGGPYACACAALQPQTTAALGLVASMTHCAGPGSAELLQGMDWFDRIGHSCIVHAPRLTALIMALAAPFVHAAAEALKLVVAAYSDNKPNSSSNNGSSNSSSLSLLWPIKWAAIGLGKAALFLVGATLPEPDRQALLHKPNVFLGLIPSLLSDAFKQGGKGFFHDMRLTTLPWGLDLSRISTPTVVFQGDADVNVTVNMARWLGRHIAGADVRLFRDEAHFSLVVNHATDILQAMLHTQKTG